MIRVNPFPLITVLLAAALVVSSCTRDSETSSGVVTNGGPICGDGIVNSAVEQCDDGNDNDTDSCSNTCIASLSGSSVVTASNSVLTGAYCGDGIVNSAAEQCDDGNGDDTDTCSNSCLTQQVKDAPAPSPPTRSQDYLDCVASGADVSECEGL